MNKFYYQRNRGIEMIVIVGASASGKTEIAKILFNKYHYQKCVTTTTRLPRTHEQNGVDYHFLTKEEFLYNKKQDAFVEVTTYQNNFYGINRQDIKEERVVILDPSGANELFYQLKKKIYIVFVESSKEKRQARMLARGDNPDSVDKRLQSDDQYFQEDKLFHIDLHIYNNNETLEELADLIHKNYHLFKSESK